MSQIPNPDQYFWYTLATILGCALIWVIGRYITKQDKLMDRVLDMLMDLSTISKVHDTRLNNHDKDIERLEEHRIVTYRK